MHVQQALLDVYTNMYDVHLLLCIIFYYKSNAMGAAITPCQSSRPRSGFQRTFRNSVA